MSFQFCQMTKKFWQQKSSWKICNPTEQNENKTIELRRIEGVGDAVAKPRDENNEM